MSPIRATYWSASMISFLASALRCPPSDFNHIFGICGLPDLSALLIIVPSYTFLHPVSHFRHVSTNEPIKWGKAWDSSSIDICRISSPNYGRCASSVGTRFVRIKSIWSQQRFLIQYTIFCQALEKWPFLLVREGWLQCNVLDGHDFSSVPSLLSLVALKTCCKML